jgi:Tfp pilus assembly pilus retraction ATPase PilT
MATNVTDLLGVRMDELMRVTIERGASDLHMCVGLPPMLRIDGRLTPTEFPKLTPDEMKKLVYSILTDAQKERFEKNLELDFSHGLKGFGRFVYRAAPFQFESASGHGRPRGQTARPHTRDRAHRFG